MKDILTDLRVKPGASSFSVRSVSMCPPYRCIGALSLGGITEPSFSTDLVASTFRKKFAFE
jgi:hypothetical protein